MNNSFLNRTKYCCLGALAMVGLAAMPASAMDNVVDSVAKGCEKEFTSYCKDVTPGQGRLLACLYAHQDKISGQCDYALYDAAAKLQRLVAGLAYVAGECHDDLASYCTDFQPGKGRLLDCIKKNDAKVSDRCKQAIDDVGLEKIPAK